MNAQDMRLGVLEPDGRVPFGFELRASFEDGRVGFSGPEDLRVLTAAWSMLWQDLARNLARPWADRPGSRGRVLSGPGQPAPFFASASGADPTGVSLFHPAALDALWIDAAPTSVPIEVWFSDQQGIGEALRRVGVLADAGSARPGTGPSLALLYGSDVHSGPDFFAVALPPLLAARPDWQQHVQFEAGLTRVNWSLGSLKTEGEGWFGFAVKSILIPVAIAVLAKDVTDPAREWGRRIEMNRTLSTMQGPCRVRGHLDIDLQQLTTVFQQRVVGHTPTDVCLRQAALTLVGRNPGPIDGVAGPETRAAEAAFDGQWGLHGGRPLSIEFARAMAQALQGKKPPTTPP